MMILIAYISKTGTTKEVGEEIAKVLHDNGLETEMKELSSIQELDAYSGVIIGAPINGFRWLPEAQTFIENNQDRLKDIPTSYYMLSYLLKTGRASLKQKMKKTLDRASSIVKPVSIGYFGGKVDENFPSLFRLLFGVKKDAPLDARNWDEIRSWANELATKLNN